MALCQKSFDTKNYVYFIQRTFQIHPRPRDNSLRAGYAGKSENILEIEFTDLLTCTGDDSIYTERLGLSLKGENVKES